MTDLVSRRISRLDNHRDVLVHSLRGIEKEGLRVDPQGHLARTPHPSALGSALTNERITTDYSEALLEIITGTHKRVEPMLEELTRTHRFVYSQLGSELIWNQSMPARLPPEAKIPIAWYGTSNTGMLKHIYRRGLAERYGKAMQCIAGIHYNFSFDDAVWDLLEIEGPTLQDRRSAGYIALIRNFTRYSWLLMYLFGATPALSRWFLGDDAGGLQLLDSDTLYLPHATSLRMSDLGYQSKAQAQLKLCYNDLQTFLARLYNAVTCPWTDYEAIGTHRDGQWIQLNTNVLQIENEYYSTIRPKRSTGRCERPVTAMAERGVQYVEVRCLDIDPYQPIGISADTSRFVDAFLLFCAVADSPPFADSGYCTRSADNFATVVKQGRQPGLKLDCDGRQIALDTWGAELLDRIAPFADLLDAAYGGKDYSNVVRSQRGKLADPDTTPSALVLAGLRQTKTSFHETMLELSRQHAQTLSGGGLSEQQHADYLRMAQESVLEQQRLEQSDTTSFDDYVAQYAAALRPPAGMAQV